MSDLLLPSSDLRPPSRYFIQPAPCRGNNTLAQGKGASRPPPWVKSTLIFQPPPARRGRGLGVGPGGRRGCEPKAFPVPSWDDR
jgi:hypothetical protein